MRLALEIAPAHDRVEPLAVFVPGPEAIHRLKRRSLRWLDFA
jgi:hypothetical protein